MVFKTLYKGANVHEKNESRQDVVRFAYRQPSVSLWDLTRPGITHNISISGLPGDHIYETIKRTKTFYEIQALVTLYRWARGSLGMVLDIGANIGNHTVFFAKVLGASVVSVEPSPRAITFLRTNIDLNGITDRVKVIECAAGERSGRISLVESLPTNIGATHVAENYVNCRNHITVELRTVDEIVNELNKDEPCNISLIKIDVEGFEQKVLSGATNVIREHLPLILVEIHTDEALLWTRAMLSKYGYGAPVKLPAWSPTYLFDRGLRKMCQASLYWMWRIYRRFTT